MNKGLRTWASLPASRPPKPAKVEGAQSETLEGLKTAFNIPPKWRFGDGFLGVFGQAPKGPRGAFLSPAGVPLRLTTGSPWAPFLGSIPWKKPSTTEEGGASDPKGKLALAARWAPIFCVGPRPGRPNRFWIDKLPVGGLHDFSPRETPVGPATPGPQTPVEQRNFYKMDGGIGFKGEPPSVGGGNSYFYSFFPFSIKVFSFSLKFYTFCCFLLKNLDEIGQFQSPSGWVL